MTRPRQRRHARRGRRDVLRRPLQRVQRDDRRRAGRRHDHRRRRRAGDLDRRRDRDRGRHRHGRRDFTVSLSAAERPDRDASTTRPRTARRPRPATTRRPAATLTFAAGPDDEDGDGPGQRRHARRGRRDVHVDLANAVNATIADGTGRRHDHRRRPPPTLSIDDVTVTEGDSGTSTPPSRSRLRGQRQDVTVDYATADGTRHRPADYAAASGTLTFTPGQTTKTVTVPVNGDLLDEANETFFVNLSNPSNATIADGQGLGTITDDDPLPTVSIDDVTVTEGNSGTVDATFTVTPRRPAAGAVTVDYATADGTATAPGRLPRRRAARSPSRRARRPTGDRPRQRRHCSTRRTRRSSSTSTNAANATIADGAGPGTITDDDPTPDALDRRRDGRPRATSARRPRRSPSRSRRRAAGPSPSTTRPRTGQRHAPADYLRANGTLTFAPGQTTKQITVLVNGDLLDEADETFFVNSRPSNATIADGQGLGTITNDDGAPGALGRRRDGDRGRPGTTRHLHRHPGRSERAARDRRLRDRGRHGDRTRRLHRDQRHAHVRPGPDHEARHRAGRRRHCSTSSNETFIVDLSTRSTRRSLDAPGSARSPTTTRRRRSRSPTSP